jgi:hypothetical protein
VRRCDGSRRPMARITSVFLNPLLSAAEIAYGSIQQGGCVSNWLTKVPQLGTLHTHTHTHTRHITHTHTHHHNCVCMWASARRDGAYTGSRVAAQCSSRCDAHQRTKFIAPTESTKDMSPSAAVLSDSWNSLSCSTVSSFDSSYSSSSRSPSALQRGTSRGGCGKGEGEGKSEWMRWVMFAQRLGTAHTCTIFGFVSERQGK